MTVDETHDQAMELADEASLLKLRGRSEDAITLFRRAALLEMQAAYSLSADPMSEPSRSVLFRSAASLAYDAADYQLADRLVANGLAGFPPAEIEKELKDLYEDINFMRHAEAEGVEITDEGIVMTIAGQATFYGGALVDHVIDRIARLQREFYRTVERLMGLEFRTERPVDTKIREKFNLYLDTQFASSFGVYLLVGTPVNQPLLFPELEITQDIDGATVIREVMECLRMLESAHPERLRERITDETYFDDFVGFAKQIAPDGKEIKTVAFRSGASEDQRALVLRKTREQIKESLPIVRDENDGNEVSPFRLTGHLFRANKPSGGKFGSVGLQSFELGRKITLQVPIGLMKDTVQPNFDERVVIYGYEQGGTYYLRDIDKYREGSEDEQ